MAAEDETLGMLVPVHAGDVKKGGYLILKMHPCKAIDIKTSKTGKHGHAKSNITGICVLTGKKYNDVFPGHANLYAPIVTKTEYQLMYIDEDNVSLLDSENAEYSVPFDASNENCVELLAAYEADAEKEYKCTVLIAPIIIDEKTNRAERRERIDQWSEGKVSQ